MQSIPGQVAIRPIRKEDNQAMAAVIRQVMTEYGAVGEGYSINDPEVDCMYRNYSGKGFAFFVLLQNGKVLGGGGIAPLSGGSAEVCELRKMYILPEARGKGWGKKLLATCIDAARDNGYQFCYLETLERMQTARQLYRSFGFRPIDGQMGHTGHNSCDAWYLLDL